MKQLFTLGMFLMASAMSYGQCPGGQTQVTMTIVTDRYGDETTWQVTGPNGTPIYASGGPYTLQTANGEYPQAPVNFCVPNGSIFEVTVEDSYGDGMCCAYGDGTWTITVGGTTVASGGSFTEVEEASVALGTDLGIASLGLGSVIAQGSTQITGTVKNNGINAVSSFTMAYAVDGGAPVSQNFNTTIAPGASYAYTFSTPWNATTGSHTVNLTMSGVSGDLISANNTLNATVNVATQSVTRRTVIEEFTSSTCPPCASLNATFDPLLSSLNTNVGGTNVLAVKYQMNWPAPGNDPSYNPDGNTRRGYYGVSGIPDVYMDGGEPNGSSWANAIDNARNKPAFCDVTITHTVSGTTVNVNVSVTPYANFPGTHKLFIAATEDYYSYPASTTSQDEFHYAMRKMMPNGNGITMANLVAGQTQTFTQSHTFTMGNPAQGNYNTWSSSLNNVTLIAFVQNTGTRDILQGAKSEITTGVEEQDELLAMNLYPNPTDGQLNVSFDLPTSTTMNLTVVNMLGEVVAQQAQGFGPGSQRVTMDLSGLANGTYFLNILADGMTSTRKVVINR